MTTVGALPDAITFTREDNLILDILQQLAVTLFVVFLDLAYHRELGSNLDKSLFFCLFCHACIHVRPFGILTGSSISEVGSGVADLASVQVFVPEPLHALSRWQQSPQKSC